MTSERIEITETGSMDVYRSLLESPPLGPLVPYRPLRLDPYSINGRSVVALVRSDDRLEGIREAVKLLGGMEPVIKDVKGEILIKPNCNTDDPYPRDTHPETVRTISQMLISTGFPPDRIVLGETSGRGRGLPTRNTLANLGILEVAKELGIRVCCFEEDDWVTVKPTKVESWPRGIKIPRRIYEAQRIILTPILRPHSTATFTMSLKLAVGMLDSLGREWLHNGQAHIRKLIEINKAYSADLVIADASQVLVNKELTKTANPGVIIASGNRVASDAICVALMKLLNADRISDMPVLKHKQLQYASKIGLGSPEFEDMILRTSNLVGDPAYTDLIDKIKEELTAT
jgi:uncharacterized protein (DUF362 family)